MNLNILQRGFSGVFSAGCMKPISKQKYAMRPYACLFKNSYYYKNQLYLYYFNIHMHEMGDPNTIFLATSFTQKMPEGSDSMFSSILMLENI